MYDSGGGGWAEGVLEVLASTCLLLSISLAFLLLSFSVCTLWVCVNAFMI